MQGYLHYLVVLFLCVEMLVKPLFAVLPSDPVKGKDNALTPKASVWKQCCHMIPNGKKKMLVRCIIHREEIINETVDAEGMNTSILYCYCQNTLQIMQLLLSKSSIHTRVPSFIG